MSNTDTATTRHQMPAFGLPYALGMHRRGMHGPFDHGTPSGAQRHRARGERPCWACAEAWAQDRARRRLEAAS